MTSMNQLPKIFAIVPIIVLVYMIFLWDRDRTVLLHAPDLEETTIHIPTTEPARTPELVQDAYRLPTADSFLPHFQAVTQMQGITTAEAKAGCNWPETEKVNFQYVNDTDWVVQDRSDDELSVRRNQWHDFITHDLLPYETYKDRFEGRGIVIVAGQSRSLKRVRVLLCALTKYNSTLPIEIHYWAGEMTPESQQSLSSLWPDITFNDLSAAYNILKTNHDGIANYQLKIAAVINSRFAEPLLLDSDNIPVIDPAALYDSAVYKEYGTVFWPDIAHTRPNNPIWPITNTACRMDEYEQESGQLLVDKSRFFYHLQLAAWLDNQHSDYYNKFLLGDKDMFRFAWHALKTRYGRPRKWLTSIGTLTDGWYCGHTFAQYHPDYERVAFLHGGLIKFMPQEVIKWQRDEKGGIFQAYKRAKSGDDENWESNVDVGIKWDLAWYLPDERRKEGMSTGSCTDLYEVEARELKDIEGEWEGNGEFEGLFEECGGYWMLDED